MSQSAVLVACLVAAFVLYVAARGRLTAYQAALFGAAPKAKSDGGGNGGIAGTGVSASDAAKIAAVVI